VVVLSLVLLQLRGSFKNHVFLRHALTVGAHIMRLSKVFIEATISIEVMVPLLPRLLAEMAVEMVRFQVLHQLRLAVAYRFTD